MNKLRKYAEVHMEYALCLIAYTVLQHSNDQYIDHYRFVFTTVQLRCYSDAAL